MAVAACVTPALQTLEQAYQFIQEYVGFVSPGVLAIFLLGFFWKKTTTRAALIGALITIPLSVLLKWLPIYTQEAFPSIPFLNRMVITFIVVSVVMIITSLYFSKNDPEPKAMEVSADMFSVSNSFWVASILIFGILAALYTVFW